MTGPKNDLTRLTEVELQKPNALIALRPVNGRLTTVGRKMFNALLAQTQKALVDPESTPRLADGWFEAPLRSLLIDAGIEPNSGGAVENAKRYLTEMRHVDVDWLVVAASDKLPVSQGKVLADESGLLYRTRLIDRDGMMWAQWLVPDEIEKALACKDVLWTRLHLQTVGKLGSYSAVALYEICSRYKTHVSGLTGRQSVAWWTDALSRAPAGSERREWRKFKSEQLKPAIKEICAVTDIEIELIEHKRGRAVSEVQFKVKRVHRPTTSISLEPQLDLAFRERAEKVGISNEQCISLAKSYGEDRVRAKFRELEARVSSKELPQVASPFGYFKTLLRSGSSPFSTISDSEGGSGNVVQGRLPTSIGQIASDLQAEAALNVESRIASEFEALPSDEKNDLIDQALAAFIVSPACPVRLRPRVEARSVDHPIIAAVVRAHFARSKYGDAWRTELAL